MARRVRYSACGFAPVFSRSSARAPIERLAETLAVERLGQIVQRAHFEGVERTVVMGGQIDDDRLGPDASRDLEAVHIGKADIEEQNIGRGARDQAQRIGAVARFAHDRNIGFFGEIKPHAFAGEIHIVHDHRTDHAISRRGMRMVAVAPASLRSKTKSCAAP